MIPLNTKRMSGLAAVGLVLLTACGTEGADEAANPDNVCGDEDWCDYGEVEGAYDERRHAGIFCVLEEVRQQVADGEVDRHELAENIGEWGTDELRSGRPVIVDISVVPADETTELYSAVSRGLRAAGGSEDPAWQLKCADELTQEDIEDVEGPYRGPDGTGLEG